MKIFFKTNLNNFLSNLKNKLDLYALIFSTYVLLFIRTDIGNKQIQSIDNAPDIVNIPTLLIFSFSSISLFVSRHKYDKKIVTVCLILLILLILNFLVTPLAQFKWFINWLGFIFIFLYFSNLMINLNEFDMKMLQQYAIRVFGLSLLFFCALILPVWLVSYQSIISEIAIFSSQNLSYFTTQMGILKQHLAYFFGLMFLSGLIFWNHVSTKYKFIFIIFLILLIPIIHSSRSLFFGLLLIAFWFYASKGSFRLIYTIIFLITFLSLILHYIGIDFILMDFANNRFVGMNFAWDVIQDLIFGLGNGGYHIFVLSHPELSDKYHAIGGFPVAPESDVTYFLASWGIFTVFFLYFYWFLLKRGSLLLHFSKKLLPIERIFILMSWLFIFMGIGEDAAGMLPWFIFMALSFSVIRNHMRKSI